MRKIILIILLIAVASIVLYFIFGTKTIHIKPLRDATEFTLVKLAGEFVRLNKNELVIKTIVADETAIPSIEPEFEETIVFVDKNTEVIRYTDEKKTDEQFNKEQDIFKEQLEQYKEQGKSRAFLEAPRWYKTKIITLNEIKPGDIIRIKAEKDKDGIKAVKINIDRNIEKPKVNNVVSEGVRIELHGKIEEVLSDTITIMFKGGAASTNIKNISITDKTELVKMSKKTDEQFYKEQEEFKKTNISAPSWFIYTSINLSDLSNGQDIIVKGIEKNNRQIVAERIELLIK